MKVGILLKGSAGHDHVATGTILDVREFYDGSPVTFGRRCVPPRFFIVVLGNTRLADLTQGIREFANCRSRKVLDLTRLTEGKDGLLKTQSFVGMSAIEFRLACTDSGAYWNAEEKTAIQKELEAACPLKS